MQITVADRDAQIVAWLGRLGAASAQHVSERFGISVSTAYLRLRALTADGLVEHRKVLHGWPGMYTATKKGLRWQRIDRLRVFHLSPAGFEHAWQMASAAVALQRELPGWQLLSEREVGLLRRQSKELVAWATVGGAGSQYHRPDLALISPSGRVIAVEVELTPKDQRRLNTICRAWARARHVEHVYYLATDRAAQAVSRAVKAIHGDDRITVLALHEVARLAELEQDKEVEEVGRDRSSPHAITGTHSRLIAMAAREGDGVRWAHELPCVK